VFKHPEISHAGATSIMDGGTTNFGASQYPGTYSKSTLDDKLFNIMREMNNAVLYWSFEFNSVPAAAETWDL